MDDVVIVADSSFVIETVRLALRDSASFRVLGKLDGKAPVGQAIAEHRPGIVIVDEMQNPDDALKRIRECRGEAPGCTILLLSMRLGDAEWIARAIDAGADACVSKSTHLPSLGRLIREVADHNIISAVPRLPRATRLPESAEELTRREREILALVADGLTNARIGRELWITEQTVKFHLSNTYRKLGVSNRTEASRFAYANGLARAEPPSALAA